MRNCHHPLMSQRYQMGFLDDLKSWGQDFIDDLNEDYVDPALEYVGLSPEQAAKIKADAAAAAQAEIKQQQQQLAQDIINQATGGKSGSGSSIPSTGNVITDTVNQIEQNAMVKAIPGGIYTLGAAGLLVVFMLLRGR